MTVDEKLDLIISKLGGMESRLDNVETEISGMKHTISDIQQLQAETDNRISEMDNRISAMDKTIADIKQSQKETQLSIEYTVDKCVQALVDGYKMNAETFKTKNFEVIEHDSRVAMLTAQIMSNEINKLKSEIAKLEQVA